MTVGVIRPQNGRPAADKALGSRSMAGLQVLLLWQTVAIAMQVVAVSMARETNGFAYVVSTSAFALAYASALWCIFTPHLTRAVRNGAVLCLGITPALQWRLIDPIVFNGFDEQLHMRTLMDIIYSQALFEPHPILAVSPRYPGLEAATALVHQLGLPVNAAAMAVVVVARMVLVLALSDAVEQITGSLRAGGVAVAVYAVSAQFVWFNSQFSYQTMALPLALAAVSLIARARRSEAPRLLLCGAGICLIAVVITHHVTSVLTALFLVAWGLAERNPIARRRIFCGALIAVVATACWVMVHWQLLHGYFDPMIADVSNQVSGGGRRAAFTDGSGNATPLWQRLFIVYYALAVSAAAAWLALSYLRSRLPGRAHNPAPAQWTSVRVLLVMIAGLFPVLMAARVLPSGAEISDRSSGFVLLPISLLVTIEAIRRARSKSGRHSGPPLSWKSVTVRALTVAMASGVFVGGLLAGSGPEWARLPGDYVVSSTRSMDSETLAAVTWSAAELPRGTRIGADFVSSLLFASRAGLEPIKENVPALYFADTWGPAETAAVRRTQMQYLYVDRRLAANLPAVGWYFDKGETATPQRLTSDQLTKFDSVPGIREVYRHGPISIYDLSTLGIAEQPPTTDTASTPPSLFDQLLAGLLVGLALIAVMRSRLGAAIAHTARQFRTAAGPTLTFAVALALWCVAAMALLLAGIWVYPLVFIVIAFLLAATHFRQLSAAMTGPRPWRWIFGLGWVAIPLATALVHATAGAAEVDIHRVHKILDDPSTTTSTSQQGGLS